MQIVYKADVGVVMGTRGMDITVSKVSIHLYSFLSKLIETLVLLIALDDKRRFNLAGIIKVLWHMY